MLFIAAFLPPSSLKEGMLPAQQPDVTCKTVWNTITSLNRSHTPYQHLQWLIKYLSDHLNTSTGPSIIPLAEFTYSNLQWKRQASCKATGASNSRRSHFSLVFCLKGQISEQTLESKMLWEIKAAAFQGTVGKSSYLLPSCPRWYQLWWWQGRRLILHWCLCKEKSDKGASPLVKQHSLEHLTKLCSALWEQEDLTAKTCQWPSIWRQTSLAQATPAPSLMKATPMGSEGKRAKLHKMYFLEGFLK